jgi:phosphoglycerol geranylgeranyltransferase
MAIKKVVDVPVIYFPSGAHAISIHADAIYFMSMMNSRNLRNVIGEQVVGAPIVKKIGLEPIPMGYIIIEPGMKVWEVGEANLVRRDDLQTAVAYGLTAEFMGMSMFYVEAGSGAPAPVPPEMISAIKENVSIPLIVGGGIRDPETAATMGKAGADVVVTGTVVENGDFESTLESIVQAIKSNP